MRCCSRTGRSRQTASQHSVSAQPPAEPMLPQSPPSPHCASADGEASVVRATHAATCRESRSRSNMTGSRNGDGGARRSPPRSVDGKLMDEVQEARGSAANHASWTREYEPARRHSAGGRLPQNSCGRVPEDSLGFETRDHAETYHRPIGPLRNSPHDECAAAAFATPSDFRRIQAHPHVACDGLRNVDREALAAHAETQPRPADDLPSVRLVRVWPEAKLRRPTRSS